MEKSIDDRSTRHICPESDIFEEWESAIESENICFFCESDDDGRIERSEKKREKKCFEDIENSIFWATWELEDSIDWCQDGQDKNEIDTWSDDEFCGCWIDDGSRIHIAWISEKKHLKHDKYRDTSDESEETIKNPIYSHRDKYADDYERIADNIYVNISDMEESSDSIYPLHGEKN